MIIAYVAFNFGSEVTSLVGLKITSKKLRYSDDRRMLLAITLWDLFQNKRLVQMVQLTEVKISTALVEWQKRFELFYLEFKTFINFAIKI